MTLFFTPFFAFFDVFFENQSKKTAFLGSPKKPRKIGENLVFFPDRSAVRKTPVFGGVRGANFSKKWVFLTPPPPIFQSSSGITGRFWPFFAFFHFFLGGLPGGHFSQKKPEKKGVFGGVQNTPLFGGGGEGGSREKVRFENQILPLGPKRGFPLWKGRKWGFLDPIRLGKGLFWPFLAFSPYPPPPPPLFGPFLTFFSALNPFWHSPRWKDAPPHREAFKSKYTWTLEW